MLFLKKMICLILLLSVFCTPAAAFSGVGEGTNENPYQIENVEHLNEINDNLSANYILMNDLNLKEPIRSIGNSEKSFSGKFEGNHKTVYNISLLKNDESHNGFFSYSNGTITNLTLSNISANSEKDQGGLVGLNQGYLQNCHVKNVILTGESSGGLAASNQGTIINCSSAGDINANFGGGLVSTNSGTITDSHSSCLVIGRTAAGGLVGSNYGRIQNCNAAGDVFSYFYAGGLVGIDNSKNIENSYSTGNVTESKKPEQDNKINVKMILFALLIIGAILVMYLRIKKK